MNGLHKWALPASITLLAGVIGIGLAPVWKQARHFNTCMATWEQGYPDDSDNRLKQFLYLKGHSYCSGGQISDQAATTWLRNLYGVEQK